MFSKKNYILFIILLVLIIGAYLYTKPYKNWQKKKETDKGFLTSVNIDLVNKIEVIDKEGKTHTIIKEGDFWKYTDGWPTEKILVDAMIEKLTNITKMKWDIASINPEKKSEFETDDQGIKVKLYQGEQEVANFIIGKISSNYNSTYISRQGDNNTYLVKETFVRAFDTDSWRDRTIFNLNSDNINTIVLNYPYQKIELTNLPDSRGEVYWRAIKPYTLRLDKEKVEEFLNILTKLEADSIPEQKEEEADFDNPTLKLELKGEGLDETLIIGKTKDKKYFVKKESSGQIFLIREQQKKDLAKQIKDFR